MTMEETGSEREVLEEHLDDNRRTAVRKVSGLTWEQATTRLGHTPTSAAGILKHLTEVERWWFRVNLAGETDVPTSSTDENPDGEFDIAPDESVDFLIAEYAVACEESRVIASRHDLADRCVVVRRNGTRPSLRWVYVHMIEEIARHNGQLDIYRELLDGQTDRE